MKIAKFIVLAVAAFIVPFVMVYQNNQNENEKEKFNSLKAAYDSLKFTTSPVFLNEYYRSRDSALNALEFEKNLRKFIEEKYHAPQFNLPSSIIIRTENSNEDTLKKLLFENNRLKESDLGKDNSIRFINQLLKENTDVINVYRQELKTMNDVIINYDSLLTAFCINRPYDVRTANTIDLKKLNDVIDNLNQMCPNDSIKDKVLREAKDRRAKYNLN